MPVGDRAGEFASLHALLRRQGPHAQPAVPLDCIIDSVPFEPGPRHPLRVSRTRGRGGDRRPHRRPNGRRAARHRLPHDPAADARAGLQPTEAWILATPEGLAIACHNTQPASVQRTRQRIQRDAAPIDRVNLKIDFDGDGRTGYNFTVSLTGGIIDASSPTRSSSTPTGTATGSRRSARTTRAGRWRC